MLRRKLVRMPWIDILSSKVAVYRRRFIILALMTICIVFGVTISPGHEQAKRGEIVHNDLKITVIYDNNPYRTGLQTAWGFSCLIQGMEKTILFDTGGDGSILLANMKILGINPGEIELVVLSHIHGDHVGGLHSLLEQDLKPTVYLPKSFPKNFKRDVERYGVKVIEVHKPVKICENVYSIGELGIWIKEQSLLIHTRKGLIVITGCAHPGIVEIVERAKDLIRNDVFLVMGGFHLSGASKGQIESIISTFKKLGVHYVGPCHCSGDMARRLFEKEYQKNYIRVGVGKVITF